jgi:UDP-2,3-diacylglucosamine pyrophosphatase LpxH
MKTLIISDIHIGSKYCRESDLVEFLQSTEYDRLILAGDIIDFIKIPSFTKKTIEVLSSINFDKDIVYIVGNHDYAFREWSGSNVLGISFVEKYEFESGKRKIRVEHGDAYDGGILNLNGTRTLSRGHNLG